MGLYHRILADLARIAEDVEEALGLEKLADLDKHNTNEKSRA